MDWDNAGSIISIHTEYRQGKITIFFLQEVIYVFWEAEKSKKAILGQKKKHKKGLFWNLRFPEHANDFLKEIICNLALAILSVNGKNATCIASVHKQAWNPAWQTGD